MSRLISGSSTRRKRRQIRLRIRQPYAAHNPTRKEISMPRRFRHRLPVLAALFVAATSTLPVAYAQQAVDFSKVQIKTTKLADNFYTLEGQGGTISVLTG